MQQTELTCTLPDLTTANSELVSERAKFNKNSRQYEVIHNVFEELAGIIRGKGEVYLYGVILISIGEGLI